MPIFPTFNASVAAAVILLAREIMAWPDWPTTKEILMQTGSSRSQAYVVKSRLEQRLPELLGQPGRPPASPPLRDSVLRVSQAIQDYLLQNPGSAHLCGERFCYSDKFRRFILALVEPGQPGEGLSMAQLAEASRVPLGTLKGWFGDGCNTLQQEPLQMDQPVTIRQEYQHQIITLFQSWKGPFTGFCRMVRKEHRIPYGATAIGTLLEQVGLRNRKRSRPQAPWIDETFRKLFPGAQWLGDGCTLKVHGISVAWGSETYTFNLEAILDVASNAVVGITVSDFEEEAAVLDAFKDAVATTGRAPEAMSLDNRASNHTPGIKKVLGDAGTTLLPTTLGRGQSKAPLEGAFGLFQQALPELVVAGDSPREQARSLLNLVLVSWFRGRNGRPRKQLSKKSPAQYYQDYRPTPEEIVEARRWIAELQRRQEAMRRTREQRADAAKLEFLKQALDRLGIVDFKNQLAVGLAAYSRDAILAGVSIFEAKRSMGTVPSDAKPGPYLGGIIRNLNEEIELNLAAEKHIQNREKLHDISLKTLIRQADQLEQKSPSPGPLLRASLDRALEAPYAIDYYFWARKCAKALTRMPEHQRVEAYRRATRQIAATYKADRARKQALSLRLAQTLTDLDFCFR